MTQAQPVYLQPVESIAHPPSSCNCRNIFITLTVLAIIATVACIVLAKTQIGNLQLSDALKSKLFKNKNMSFIKSSLQATICCLNKSTS